MKRSTKSETSGCDCKGPLGCWLNKQESSGLEYENPPQLRNGKGAGKKWPHNLKKTQPICNFKWPKKGFGNSSHKNMMLLIASRHRKGCLARRTNIISRGSTVKESSAGMALEGSRHFGLVTPAQSAAVAHVFCAAHHSYVMPQVLSPVATLPLPRTERNEGVQHDAISNWFT